MIRFVGNVDFLSTQNQDVVKLIKDREAKLHPTLDLDNPIVGISLTCVVIKVNKPTTFIINGEDELTVNSEHKFSKTFEIEEMSVKTAGVQISINYEYGDDLQECECDTIVVEGGAGSGATYTPSVSPDGVLSWTNDKGLPNPSAVNIKGVDGTLSPEQEQLITDLETEIVQARNGYNSLVERMVKEKEGIYADINSRDFLPFTGESLDINNSKVGYTKNMKLKGRTLQNVILNKEVLIESTRVSLRFNQDLIKSNTKYSTNLPSACQYGVANLDGSWKRNDYLTDNLEIILKENEIIYNIFLAYSAGYTEQDVVYLNNAIMIEAAKTQGLNVPSLSHFEGIKAVGETEGNKVLYKSTGKNLFDLNRLVTENLYNASANPLNRCASPFIRVKPNSAYSLSLSSNIITQDTGWTKILGYTAENEVAGRNLIDNSNIHKTFSIPSDIKYIRVGFDATIDEVRRTEVQLIEGAVKLSYEPYREELKEIQLPQGCNFNGLTDVQDTIEETKDGIEYVQRFTQIILNGSSDEKLSVANVGANTISANLSLGNAVARSGEEAICNRLSYVDGLWQDLPKYDVQAFDIGGAGTLNIKILLSNLNTPDLSGLRQYLQSNPITVRYQLAEPIRHKLSAPLSLNTKTYLDKTYITSANGIKPTVSCEAAANVPAVISDLNSENTKLRNEVVFLEGVNSNQDTEIQTGLMASADLFEMLLTVTPNTLRMKLINPGIIKVYKTLVEKGLKTIEEVPSIIRVQVQQTK